jgi:hypothetical protein
MGVVPQPVVGHHDPQRRQQLPLVLVNPFDLGVEQGRGVELDAMRLGEPVDEAALGLALGVEEPAAESRVIRERQQALPLDPTMLLGKTA